MHWHAEMTLDQLEGPPRNDLVRSDLAPNDNQDETASQVVVEAALTVARALAQAIGAETDALVSVDCRVDSDTSSRAIQVTVAVP